MDVVAQIYADMMSGKVADFLAKLSDDVEWHVPGGSAAHVAAKLVPYAGVYKSKAAITEQYLPAYVAAIKLVDMKVHDLIAQGDKVVAIGQTTGTVLLTGKTVTVEWAQLWVLKDGLVTKFKDFGDTDTSASAFHKSDDHAHDRNNH